jgi:uncharacterized lipoprotein YddW (UPF0748 family)
MWVDAFHAGLRTSSETSAVIAAARAAKCNAVVVQVRKRGDAYYRNGLEPVAVGVASGFDPLADLIQKGHTGTPRVEVHAWIVSYNIWNNQNTPPSQSTHPYNLHPDWLTQKQDGTLWDGGNYAFDQGHPGVQQHTYDVAMDIVTRYDVDGIHLDYIRYSEHDSSVGNQPWGYNPVTVERYKRLKNVNTTPAPNDSTWLQWRRDQVTALVRKIFLNTWYQKRNVRVSAALIAWGTPPSATLASWQSTNAYGRVLQDWRSWMGEGILDLACPMNYRVNTDPSGPSGFKGWADFTKDNQFDRQAAIGGGWYLNSIANNIEQIKVARAATTLGRFGAGVIGYSYAVPNKDNVSQSTTWKAFTDDATAESYDPGGTPVFASTTTVPTMPWKTDTTRGNLMGTLWASDTEAPLDGATVQLSGPISRTITSDGTGFYGAVSLPTGTYTVTVTSPGFEPVVSQVAVAGADVAKKEVVVPRKRFRITNTSKSSSQLAISWTAVPGRRYQVQSSSNLTQWSPASTVMQATSETMSFTWPIPGGSGQGAFLRVAEQP